jgi:uracil DNA glycosylase
MTTAALSAAQQKEAMIAHYKQMLGSNERWAQRGLIVLLNAQTHEEQNMEATVEHNKVGFSAFDAEILTSIAKQLKDRGTLSPKQMALVFKRMPKYAGQLLKVSRKQGEAA